MLLSCTQKQSMATNGHNQATTKNAPVFNAPVFNDYELALFYPRGRTQSRPDLFESLFKKQAWPPP